MGDTLAQDRFAMPEPFLGPHQFPLKLSEISSTKVLEFAPVLATSVIRSKLRHSLLASVNMVSNKQP
jgi:hypothetical protein